MSIDTKEFERLMTMYCHGCISRESLMSYFYGEGEDSSSNIIFNLYGEQIPFLPPAIPEIEKQEVFGSIESRFEILDL